MVEKVNQPSWWLKEKEGDSALGSMIIGGIFGTLIGIIIIFSFSNILFEALGGNIWSLYGFAVGFVVIGALFGWAAGKDKKTSLVSEYRVPSTFGKVS
ncbi:MAG: hypothetical protein ABH864_03570 [archaeon]